MGRTGSDGLEATFHRFLLWNQKNTNISNDVLFNFFTIVQFFSLQKISMTQIFDKLNNRCNDSNYRMKSNFCLSYRLRCCKSASRCKLNRYTRWTNFVKLHNVHFIYVQCDFKVMNFEQCILVVNVIHAQRPTFISKIIMQYLF